MYMQHKGVPCLGVCSFMSGSQAEFETVNGCCLSRVSCVLGIHWISLAFGVLRGGVRGVWEEYVIILSPDSSVAQNPILPACICLPMSYWHILKSRFATPLWITLWAKFGAAAINHQLFPASRSLLFSIPSLSWCLDLTRLFGGARP